MSMTGELFRNIKLAAEIAGKSKTFYNFGHTN